MRGVCIGGLLLICGGVTGLAEAAENAGFESHWQRLEYAVSRDHTKEVVPAQANIAQKTQVHQMENQYVERVSPAAQPVIPAAYNPDYVPRRYEQYDENRYRVYPVQPRAYATNPKHLSEPARQMTQWPEEAAPPVVKKDVAPEGKRKTLIQKVPKPKFGFLKNWFSGQSSPKPQKELERPVDKPAVERTSWLKRWFGEPRVTPVGEEEQRAAAAEKRAKPAPEKAQPYRSSVPSLVSYFGNDDEKKEFVKKQRKPIFAFSSAYQEGE